MRCPVLGSDGSVSKLWLERLVPEHSGEITVLLKWNEKTQRALFTLKSDASVMTSLRTGSTLTLGDTRVTLDNLRQEYRLTYRPSVGPDHELELWVRKPDFEKLLSA